VSQQFSRYKTGIDHIQGDHVRCTPQKKSHILIHFIVIVYVWLLCNENNLFSCNFLWTPMKI